MWIAVVCLFALAILTLLSSLYALAVTGVPVLRTPAIALDELVEALGDVQPALIVDAGCSDGRSLRRLCRATGAPGRGYELNGFVWLWAWLRARLFVWDCKLSIRWADYRRADFEGVDLVYAFLMPSAMRLLGEKCQEEMAEGTLLVSLMWPVPDWEPVRTCELGPRKDPLYF